MTSFLAHYGIVAIFLLMAIDAVFPAASELVMVYGGALASGALTHELDVFGAHTTGAGAYIAVVLAGVVGYQVGAVVGWGVGWRGGEGLVARRGRWLHVSPDRLERARRWFRRWDMWAVAVGRITPVARSFISIPAGVFKMPFARYNLLTLAGNSVWCLAFAGIGWAVGASYKSVDHGFRDVEYAIVVLIVAAIAYWIVQRRRTATIRRSHADSAR